MVEICFSGGLEGTDVWTVIGGAGMPLLTGQDLDRSLFRFTANEDRQDNTGY